MFLKIVLSLSLTLFHNRYVRPDHGKVKIVDDSLIRFNNIHLSSRNIFILSVCCRFPAASLSVCTERRRKQSTK